MGRLVYHEEGLNLVTLIFAFAVKASAIIMQNNNIGLRYMVVV